MELRLICTDRPKLGNLPQRQLGHGHRTYASKCDVKKLGVHIIIQNNQRTTHSILSFGCILEISSQKGANDHSQRRSIPIQQFPRKHNMPGMNGQSNLRKTKNAVFTRSTHCTDNDSVCLEYRCHFLFVQLTISAG